MGSALRCGTAWWYRRPKAAGLKPADLLGSREDQHPLAGDATCRWAGSRGSAGFLLAAKVRISLSRSILGALKNFGPAAEKVLLCRRLRRGASA
jgi:hypothetical protein